MYFKAYISEAYNKMGSELWILLNADGPVFMTTSCLEV